MLLFYLGTSNGTEQRGVLGHFLSFLNRFHVSAYRMHNCANMWSRGKCLPPHWAQRAAMWAGLGFFIQMCSTLSKG